jgi:glycosyltransferase involved in cell wall biosynthesis
MSRQAIGMPQRRVLVVSHEGIHDRSRMTASRRFTLNSLRALTARGYEISHISWGPDSSINTMLDGIRLIHVQYSGATRGAPSGFTSRFVSLGSSFYVSQIFTLLSRGPPLSRFLPLLRGRNFDVILHEGPDGSPLPRQLARLYRLPLIERAHWVGAPVTVANLREWSEFIGLGTARFDLVSRAARLCIGRIVDGLQAGSFDGASRVIVYSERDRRVLLKKGIAFVDLIPPSVSPPPSSGVPRICEDTHSPTVSFSAPLKVHSNLISAIAFMRMASDLPNVRFQLVTDQPESLVGLSVPANVEAVPFSGRLAKDSALARSDLVLIPALTGHGIQTKVVEAFSYGVPVVVTSVVADEFPDVNDGTELIIEDNPRRWTGRIASLLCDAKALETMRCNVHKYVRRHLDVGAEATQIEATIHRCFNQFDPASSR